MSNIAVYLYLALVVITTGAFLLLLKYKRIRKIQIYNELPQMNKQQNFLELLIFQTSLFVILIIQHKYKEPYKIILILLMMMLIQSLYKKKTND
jgi:hypothetical protein